MRLAPSQVPSATGPRPPDLESQAQTLIGQLMAGEGPYTREVQDQMRSGAYEDFAGGLTAENKNAMNRASAQGNLYSASSGAEAAQNERAGRAALGGANRAISQQAAEGNFAAKIQGLQAYQTRLQGEREERLANAKNAVEREAIKSSYDQAILTTQMQIDQQERASQRSAGAAGSAASREREWQLEDWWRNYDAGIEQRDYEDAWKINAAANAATGA